MLPSRNVQLQVSRNLKYFTLDLVLQQIKTNLIKAKVLCLHYLNCLGRQKILMKTQKNIPGLSIFFNMSHV